MPHREACLRQEGFEDVFAAVKAEENDKALQLLPSILQYAFPHMLILMW